MYIFVDVETNGIGEFHPPTQIITQLSFIKTDLHGNIVQKYSNLIKGAEKLANIPQVVFTLEQLNRDGVELEYALINLKNAMEDNPLFVAHNAEFDSSIIKRDADILGIDIELKNCFCTMKSSTNFCKIISFKKKEYKWPKLSELAKKLDIEYDSTKLHNSEVDTDLLRECFLKGKNLGVFR